MGRSRYKFYNNSHPYFLTMTTVDWLPVFTLREAAEQLLRSLSFIQKERAAALYAYVIMEHHLHCVVSHKNLPKIIKEFKSFTARAVIDVLVQYGYSAWLEKLHALKAPYKSQSKYQLWQEGSHPQEILSEQMMLQKIEYIHNNPVKRGYIEFPREWRYSSARNYEGEAGLIPVMTDWRNENGETEFR